MPRPFLRCWSQLCFLVGLHVNSLVHDRNREHLRGIEEDVPSPLTSSEREVEEKKLRASETRYRRLFESAKDGILILDAETGQVLDANPFLISLLGYTHADLLGKNVWDLGPFKNVAVSKAAFKELQDKEYVRHEDLPLQTRIGSARTELFNATFATSPSASAPRKSVRSSKRSSRSLKRWKPLAASPPG